MPENVLDALIRRYDAACVFRRRFSRGKAANRPWQGSISSALGGASTTTRRKRPVRQQFFQTNGILLNEDWCRLFHEYRFLVGLSLDGPEEIHDRIRHTPGGEWHVGTGHGVGAAHGPHAGRVQHPVRNQCRQCRMGADLVGWFVREGFHYLQFIRV
jgi:hypothetical protein